MEGIVGVKPSRDVIPIVGVVPACESIDCLAIFTQSIQDASTVHERVARKLQADSKRAGELTLK